jgi:hypothetical protein
MARALSRLGKQSAEASERPGFDAAWVLLAALILLLPAMVWGRPFVFGDTIFYYGWGGDVLDALQRPWPHPGQPWVAGRSLHGWGFGLHDATPADLRFNLTWLTARSAFYAAPFHLLARLGGLWLVAGLQALASAWVVRVAIRALAPASSGLIYIGVIAALTAASSLGFVTDYAMPDIFGGLAVLAAAVLMVFADRLGRAERVGLVGLIVYAVLAHAENGLNVAAAFVLGFLWYWRSGAAWRAALARAGPTVIALAIGLAMAGGGGWILNMAFGRPVHMAPFAASRMLADGDAQSYLRQACPGARLAACDLANSPPAEIEHYLWVYPLEGLPPARIADPAKYTLAQFDRLQRRHVTDAEAEHRDRFVSEQRQLVLGSLRTDGLQFARQALTNGAVAFLNFGVSRDFDSARLVTRGGQTQLREQMDSILPGGVECVRPDSEACGRYDLGWIAPLQYVAVLLSFVFLGVCGFHRTAAPTSELFDFLSLTLGLVLVNAFLCGAISGPYGRYQARVEWLIPLGALFLVVQWVERAALARSGQAEVTPVAAGQRQDALAAASGPG